MKNYEVTVAVADIYRDLADSCVPAPTKERMVKTELKRRFKNAGIIFYDRPGLYPIPPCRTKFKMAADGMAVITIYQQIYN
jgi:hypothetical protein